MHQVVSKYNHIYRWGTYVMVALILFLFSCKADQDLLYQNELRPLTDVRQITTTYVSHQSDTQQKDGKKVAVAYFDSDGNLERISQHSSYPYDYAEPFDWSLWPETKSDYVSHLLDGLSLGAADRNFLYGNDWPKLFVKYYQPYMIMGLEGSEPERELTYHDEDFPQLLKFSQHEQDAKRERKSYFREEQHKFEADQGKVSSYAVGYRWENVLGERQPDPSPLQLKETRYEYDGDLLTKVFIENRVYRFEYESNRLVRSYYELNERVYNTRHYHYNETGLKTQTDMYNVHGELEYTIHYEYDFWDL